MILYDFSNNNINDDINEVKSSFNLDNKIRTKEFIFNEAFSIFIQIRFLEYIKSIKESNDLSFLKYFKKVNLNNKYPSYSELKEINELEKMYSNLKISHIENEMGYFNLENTVLENKLEKVIKNKISLNNYKLNENLLNEIKLKFKEIFEEFENNNSNNLDTTNYLKTYINIYDNFGYFIAKLIAIVLNKRVSEDPKYINVIEKVLKNYGEYSTEYILEILNIDLKSDVLYKEVLNEIEKLF